MKKRLVSIAAALLFAMPGAAMAQQQEGEWMYPDETGGAKQQCFAMTLRGDRAFAFQAPTAGGQKAVFAFFGPEAFKDTPGEITLILGVNGKWAGSHAGAAEDQPGTSSFMWAIDSWSDIASFPDRFHVTVRKGSTMVFDGDLTGFRAAVAHINQCVTNRGG